MQKTRSNSGSVSERTRISPIRTRANYHPNRSNSPLRTRHRSAGPAPNPNAEILEAIRSLATAVVAAVTSSATVRGNPLPLPSPSVELAATSTAVSSGDDEEQTKLAAFNEAQKRLMRTRKSTIAQLLALAMIRKQQEATAAGQPDAAAGSLEALASMANDPIQVARIVAMKPPKEMSVTDWDALELAWTQFTTARGTIGAVNESGRKLYGKAAAAALAAHKRKSTKEEGATKAKRVIDDIFSKGADIAPEHFQTLAENLKHLSHAELTEARSAIENRLNKGKPFNMKGKRKLEDRVNLILDHVAEKLKSQGPPAPKEARKGKESPEAAPEPEPAAPPPEAAPEPEPAAPPPKPPPNPNRPVPSRSRRTARKYPSPWRRTNRPVRRGSRSDPKGTFNRWFQPVSQPPRRRRCPSARRCKASPFPRLTARTSISPKNPRPNRHRTKTRRGQSG